MKRQILYHYLKGICNITSHHSIFEREIVSPKPNHPTHQIQTDDIDDDFSKVFTEYIFFKLQQQNSQRANSVLTNDVFSLIYRYKSIIESKETQNLSPLQKSRHSTIRHEINIFSKFLDSTRESLINNETSQNVKPDLQKISALFVIDYFVHNIDFIAQSRKSF